jgi:PPM family protein phosphatase
MSDSPVIVQPSILFAEESDRGTLRQVNQDSVLHVSIALGELMIVADGIGGENTGVVSASQMAVQLIHSYLAGLPDIYPADKAIREAAEKANAKITPVDKDPEIPQLREGTSVIVALLQQKAEGAHAWIGHIGDCRAYLARAGRLHRLTKDHSGAQSLLDRNLVTPEDAYRHPDASVLTRSLGVRPEVEIEIEKHSLAVGDTLLLCSDGLWRSVPEIEIERAASGPTVGVAALNLLHLALEIGGQDNITIAVARLIETRDIPRKSQHSNLFAGILVLFVLAFIGLCVLTYLTFIAP